MENSVLGSNLLYLKDADARVTKSSRHLIPSIVLTASPSFSSTSFTSGTKKYPPTSRVEQNAKKNSRK